MNDPSLSGSLLALHPAHETLERLFSSAGPRSIAHTHLTPGYLEVVAGIVDFFRARQDWQGAIIDPYDQVERQYSTPAFALAAATLAERAGRKDLVEPASRALTCAILALALRTTADNHPDFYAPLVVRAQQLLARHAAGPILLEWAHLLTKLVPETAYRDPVGRNNWNVVNVAGECLRREQGFVSSGQLKRQAEYIENCLALQLDRFTEWGMYVDPAAPLAYDAFSRLWLEEMVADEAYRGPQRRRLEEVLALGGLTTLLLLSPTGEWPCGGRSALHQWNEAQVAAICEMNASRWKDLGRQDIAGSFKRAARLALGSVARWRRPSGDLWIVKNRADPASRHGCDSYSGHSHYNLLTAAMLSLASHHADESIGERPLPSETGAYALYLGESFHKMCACAGGSYLWLDSAANPHYNATGLLRMHRAGVEAVLLTDSTALYRAYGPRTLDSPRMALAPGLAWKESLDDPEWRSLAGCSHPDHHDPRGEGAYPGQTIAWGTVRETEVRISPGRDDPQSAISFSITYHLQNDDPADTQTVVTEEYCLAGKSVDIRMCLEGDPRPAATRVQFPAIVSDGAAEISPCINGSVLTIEHQGSRLTWEIVEPQGVALRLDETRIPVRYGFVQAVVGDLPDGVCEARCVLTMEKS